ncbi:hypothetical protein CLU79DRAFT_719390 [Phycomyces nitens]|nr:hypothetical protein CLU79DRAFT_719390 [Phycomyces nitens]
MPKMHRKRQRDEYVPFLFADECKRAFKGSSSVDGQDTYEKSFWYKTIKLKDGTKKVNYTKLEERSNGMITTTLTTLAVTTKKAPAAVEGQPIDKNKIIPVSSVKATNVESELSDTTPETVFSITKTTATYVDPIVDYNSLNSYQKVIWQIKEFFTIEY